MPNWAWERWASVEPASRPARNAARPRRAHERGAIDRAPQHRVGGRQGRTDVEHHLDVGAQQPLDVGRRLGREVVAAAVVGGAEDGALVADLRLQREDLVSARVGQHVSGPGHEPVQVAQLGDEIGAGPQHQVVRVAEHDLGAEVLHVRRRQRAHRCPGPDRHEHRRLEGALRRAHPPGPGQPVGGVDLDLDDPIVGPVADEAFSGHWASPPRSPWSCLVSNMASPNDRKR